ncbi:MAG: MarR family transcriptional regulator [Hyphomicrobiaceae bacterium]
MTNESDESDSLLLENQLCHALHHAARSIAKVYKETLQEAGLTYPQYLVLITLLEGGRLSVGDICTRLNLDSGTVTPLLKRMEANGHVTRARNRDDERIVMVQLTQAGRGLREVALRARAKVVQRLQMPDREILRLRSKLMDLADRLDA